MRVPITRSVLAAVKAAVLGLLMLAAAREIVTRCMAVVSQASDPELALSYDRERAQAWLTRAQARGIFALPPKPGPTAEDLTKARQFAEQALWADPLAPQALTYLARIAEVQGDAARAAALMKMAGGRALRDIIAQSWLLVDGIKRGDYGGALGHLDAILRTHPESYQQALPFLAAFVTYPEARGPLAKLIGTNPPWRAWFMSAAPNRVADRSALQSFYGLLRVGPNPPTSPESEPYLERLVKDGLYRQAYQEWIATLPEERRADAGDLYNGAFQYPLSGAEFDWKIEPAFGAAAEIAAGTRSEPQKLRVEFSGARVDFHNVRHLLVLPPGRYQLTGEVEATGLHSERGLWWRVYCHDHPEVSLGHSDLVAESAPWHGFAMAFDVPADKCQVQVLQLELPARVALERVIGGVVSYRGLSVAPQQDARTNADTTSSARTSASTETH